MNTAQLKKEYKERIAPALMKQFNYSSPMQIPVLKKIVINQGLGSATQDKKIIDVCYQRALGYHRPESCCHGFEEGRCQLQTP